MSNWLHEHLVRDHGRAHHELNGLPLAAVHRLEHVDQAMELLHLDHRHHRGELSAFPGAMAFGDADASAVR
jgi:hypothetical protein